MYTHMYMYIYIYTHTYIYIYIHIYSREPRAMTRRGVQDRGSDSAVLLGARCSKNA